MKVNLHHTLNLSRKQPGSS